MPLAGNAVLRQSEQNPALQVNDRDRFELDRGNTSSGVAGGGQKSQR